MVSEEPDITLYLSRSKSNKLADSIKLLTAKLLQHRTLIVNIRDNLFYT